MAKLKLKLEDIGNLELDGTSEELASFVKTLRLKPITEAKGTLPEEIKTPTEEEKRVESILKNSIEEGIKVEVTPLPTVDDVVDYITSKPAFEHNTKELQEKFLGKGIRYRDDPYLYGRFDTLIRNAKKIIMGKYIGTFVTNRIIPLQGKTHVKVYGFKKREELASASFEPSGAHHRIISEQA